MHEVIRVLVRELLLIIIIMYVQAGYSIGSVFASSLYIASSCPRLLGASIEDEMAIREWIEFYCSWLRPPSPWQRISKESLNSCVEVTNCNTTA